MTWIIVAQISGGFGYFDVGLRGVDITSVNDVLKDAGYDALPSSFLSLGGFGYRIRGKILLGGGGYGMLERKIESGDRVFAISGGAGFFEGGYMIARLGPMYLFPILSIGGGGISMTISDTTGISFQDAVQGGQFRQLELEGGHIVLGARLTGFIPMGGLVLTISTGYTYSPLFYLKSPYVEVSGAPEASLSGFHISIGLGGGYIENREER